MLQEGKTTIAVRIRLKWALGAQGMWILYRAPKGDGEGGRVGGVLGREGEGLDRGWILLIKQKERGGGPGGSRKLTT